MNVAANSSVGDLEVLNPNWLNDEPSIVRKVLHALEAWLGAICGTAMAYALVYVLVAIFSVPAPWTWEDYAVVLGLVAIFEGPFLFRVWAATLTGDFPLGPAVAKHSKEWMPFLRAFRVAWWLLHILCWLLVIVSIEIDIMKQPQPGLLHTLLFTLGIFGMTVCCNVIIALLTKAIWDCDSAVHTFWKWRLAVDTVLTGVAVLVVFG